MQQKKIIQHVKFYNNQTTRSRVIMCAYETDGTSFKISLQSIWDCFTQYNVFSSFMIKICYVKDLFVFNSIYFYIKLI